LVPPAGCAVAVALTLPSAAIVNLIIVHTVALSLLPDKAVPQYKYTPEEANLLTVLYGLKASQA
jgi:hypothetical protein